MTDKKPDNHTFHIIKGVKAYYPKIDKPYRFDSSAGAKGKSVPCAATDDGAKYELPDKKILIGSNLPSHRNFNTGRIDI